MIQIGKLKGTKQNPAMLKILLKEVKIKKFSIPLISLTTVVFLLRSILLATDSDIGVQLHKAPFLPLKLRKTPYILLILLI